MREIRGNNFADLYTGILTQVLKDPDHITAPRGQKIKEIINAYLVLDNPKSNMFESEVRVYPRRYLAGELIWYFSGRNDLTFIQKFSKFWNHIANTDGTCNSAYGKLLFTDIDQYGITQWKWALESLIKDKDTRQAVMHFNRPFHQYQQNKDFVCTLNGVFHIRNNALDFTIMMRSNDVHFGLTYDLPFFTLLQQQMHRHLLPHYPDLRLGKYYHFANSLHIYERNFDELESMLKKPIKEAGLPELDTDLVSDAGRVSLDISDLAKYIEKDHEPPKMESEFLQTLYEWTK